MVNVVNPSGTILIIIIVTVSLIILIINNLDCTEYCLECTNGDYDQCSSCDATADYHLKDGTCVTECDPADFVDPETNECSGCHESCLSYAG